MYCSNKSLILYFVFNTFDSKESSSRIHFFVVVAKIYKENTLLNTYTNN